MPSTEAPVYTCGTFDGDLHEGHINMLKQCKAISPDVIVFVAPDWLIKQCKNRSPIYDQHRRMSNLLATGLVTGVITNSHDTHEANLQQILAMRPRHYAFGEDQLIDSGFDNWNQKLKKALLMLQTEVHVLKRTPGVSTTQIYFSKQVCTEWLFDKGGGKVKIEQVWHE